MPNVGYATLQIIPSVRGIGDELRRQLVAPAQQAGQQGGEEAGHGFADRVKSIVEAISIAEAARFIGEQFTEAFSSAVEQGGIVNTLQAQLGASDKAASKYGKVVGALYAKGVTDSFEQGAEAVRAIVNAGLAPPDATNAQLASIATEMTDVANTFGTEMGLQTQAISALLKNHLAPDASSALDVITTGLQTLGPNAEDLLETFQEYPVQLKKLGLDAQTSLGLFQQGLQGGARDTDIIADALKEFSIRSIDMSTTSRTAYKQLGLNARDMEKQIGKGGESARAGLQTVLDKLRAIHDPVKREAAAVGLFGTQAEDAGQALFALDPRKAVSAFGDVSGAAKNLGSDLRTGPSYELTLFKRTVQQGLVTFLGGKVVPVLAKWGRVFDDDVLPPLSVAGGILNEQFVPAVQGTVSVVRSTVDWFRRWGIWLAPLAILIAGVTLALTGESVALGIASAIFAVYRGVVAVGTLVTEGFAVAQAAVNAVMEANPIILVITAVLALAAAVYIAWKRSQTFRDIVMGAWAGIEAAGLAAWRDVLKPVIDGLVTGWQAVADGAVWLWQTILSPVFSGIGLAAQILATIVGVVLYLAFQVWWLAVKFAAGQVMAVLTAAGAVGMWLWTNVFSPVLGWIEAGFRLWWAGVMLYVSAVQTGLVVLGDAGIWLWQKAISPVLGWIVGGFKLWWTGVMLYIGAVKAGVFALGEAGMWLWTNAISPSLSAIGGAAKWLYDKGLLPPLTKAKGLAHDFGQAFVDAKDRIGTEWGKLEDLAKKPIQFIIDTVYNHGLVGVWNKVASAFGAPKLSPFKFATGGILPGYTPGRDVHLAALSGGEAVMRPEWTRAMGPGYVNAMNAAAARGGVTAVQRAAGIPAFKSGGVFGWVGSAANAVAGAGSAAWRGVKKGASWLKDTLAASARAGVEAVVRPLLDQIPGLDTGWGQMARRLPEHMINALFGYADSADRKGASASAEGTKAGAAAAQSIARRLLPSFGFSDDQMGPLIRLWTSESGWRWNATNASSGAYGIPQSLPANKMAAAGKDWRTNAATQIKWGLGYIRGRYGDPATAWASWLSHSPHWYDSGGTLGPGLTLAMNGTGRPEAILTASQWATAAAAIAQTAQAARSTARTDPSSRRGLTVPVYYNAPAPENPEKAAMEIGRRVQRAVTV